MTITIKEMQKQVHQLAREKGWWPAKPFTLLEIAEDEPIRNTELGVIDLEKANIPEKLMLMVSELGEALEFYRNDNQGAGIQEAVIYPPLSDKPDGFWIELADTIIRILDLAGAYDIDMEQLVKLKHEFNKTRPFRHGNKKC
jgi:hypothetical protein